MKTKAEATVPAVTKRGYVQRRYRAPVVDVVKMDDVPEPPPMAGRIGIADVYYAKLCDLKMGAALRVQFESSAHGDYVRMMLRKKAKADEQFVSTSRSEDGLTRYFWLEKA